LSNFHVTESGKTLVTLIPGDGIGPEVVDSTIRIIEATGAPIEWEERHAGERVFLEGQASGVRQDTIESIRKTRVVMKGPLGTPVGYGEKSANVTLRKLFETYGNIRPAREYPGVKTPYSGRGIDLVVVRENVEDLYAGIEYMLTPGVAQGLKLISRKGTEKIVRLAFELARAEGRESVVAMSKANIMKMTEGTLKSVFEEVSLEYDDIESWHVIVDNAAHQLVKLPEQYSVLVTTNMNGDILSDLSSALIGGLGFAPSANIGNEVFIAEAVHGSAPKYAGKDVINPTAMILSGVMMLRHLDMFEEAALIENAVITTLEEGKVMTRDVVGDERQGGTTGYTNEIIKNLGKKPTDWKIREYKPIKLPQLGAAPDFVKVKTRQVCGVDIFIESASDKISIGQSMERICEGRDLYLKMVDSRGTMLYPPNDVMTDTVDAWRARFMLRDDAAELNDAQLIDLLQAVAAEHMWAHVEKLQRFDGEDGFTKAQGED
jgi:isocitrate dehydrogenase